MSEPYRPSMYGDTLETGEKKYDPYVRRDSQSFKNLFNMIDVDNSGEITTEELQQALEIAFSPAEGEEGEAQDEESEATGPQGTKKKCNFNQFAAEIFISLVDKNASGHIEYLEFYQLLQMMQRWVFMFQHFKKSKSSRTMTKNEFKAAITKIGWINVANNETFLNVLLATYCSQQSYDMTKQKFDYNLALDDFISVCGKIQLLKVRHEKMWKVEGVYSSFVEFGIKELSEMTDFVADHETPSAMGFH